VKIHKKIIMKILAIYILSTLFFGEILIAQGGENEKKIQEEKILEETEQVRLKIIFSSPPSYEEAYKRAITEVFFSILQYLPQTGDEIDKVKRTIKVEEISKFITRFKIEKRETLPDGLALTVLSEVNVKKLLEFLSDPEMPSRKIEIDCGELSPIIKTAIDEFSVSANLKCEIEKKILKYSPAPSSISLKIRGELSRGKTKKKIDKVKTFYFFGVIPYDEILKEVKKELERDFPKIYSEMRTDISLPKDRAKELVDYLDKLAYFRLVAPIRVKKEEEKTHLTLLIRYYKIVPETFIKTLIERELEKRTGK